MIPKPFASVEITFDALHHVAPTADEAEFEDERARLEHMLAAPTTSSEKARFDSARRAATSFRRHDAHRRQSHRRQHQRRKPRRRRGTHRARSHAGLAVVLVGDDPASQAYVRSKDKTCRELGMHSVKHELPADTSQAELIALVQQLNADPAIHGILVQSPPPAAHRRTRHRRGDRSAQGRGRLSPGQRRQARARRCRWLRAVHAARLPAAAHRERHRDDGRERRRARPLDDRRQTDGAAPDEQRPRRRRHRHRRALAHAESRRRLPRARTSSSPRSASPSL